MDGKMKSHKKKLSNFKYLYKGGLTITFNVSLTARGYSHEIQ